MTQPAVQSPSGTLPSELVRRRISVRAYQPQPIPAELREALSASLAEDQVGPLGTRGRLELVAATEGDSRALKGLGTYGFVKDAPGFLVGAVQEGPAALEDFGYLMERAILRATDLGLGTCWLGGTFARSRFARAIDLGKGEVLPAVTAVGLAGDPGRVRAQIRKRIGSIARLPSQQLFFDESLDQPYAGEGPWADVLEAVRWAPSASNKQPWRLVRTGSSWHFYLQRTPGYGRGSLVFTLMRMADLQRVDMGIAMCHLELVAREVGLEGTWVREQPSLDVGGWEYAATWQGTP